jgi:hypothetical protein
LISHLIVSVFLPPSRSQSSDVLRLVLVGSIRPDPILLTPRIDSLKVFLLKFEIFKVGPDPLWSDRFRDDDESLVSSPCNQDLGGGLVDLLGDFLDGWCVDDSGFTGNVVS